MRVGQHYDLRNVIDLIRYLLPTPPVPVRFRRRMIALGAGAPTRAICSTLIAQAFQSIHYPILPEIDCPSVDGADANREARSEILHIRHHSLFVPRDFDISPYFAIVKPTLQGRFDHRTLIWGFDDSPIAIRSPDVPPGLSNRRCVDPRESSGLTRAVGIGQRTGDNGLGVRSTRRG